MTSGEDGEASIALLPTAGFAFWGFQGGTVGLLSRSGDPDLCLAGGQSCRLHWPCSGAGNSKRLAHFIFFFVWGGQKHPKVYGAAETQRPQATLSDQCPGFMSRASQRAQRSSEAVVRGRPRLDLGSVAERWSLGVPSGVRNRGTMAV